MFKFTRFSPTEQFDRVEGLLSGRVSGENLCQAFAITSTALANQQSVNLTDLARKWFIVNCNLIFTLFVCGKRILPNRR